MSIGKCQSYVVLTLLSSSHLSAKQQPVQELRLGGLLRIFFLMKIQSNFNGLNTFGTMKICSRQGEFEPLRVYYRARSGGINRDIFSMFLNMKVYCVFS